MYLYLNRITSNEPYDDEPNYDVTNDGLINDELGNEPLNVAVIYDADVITALAKINAILRSFLVM